MKFAAAKSFSIKELEIYSEVKSHTLRMWEKRYSIFQPSRTQGNARMYSLADLKLLLNLSLLNKIGYRISKLASMKEAAIEYKICSVSSSVVQQQHVLNQLILCMHSGRIDDFEAVLDSCVRDYGVDETLEIILLFLEKVDLLAYNNTRSEVHFVVTAVRSKIIFGIETLQPVPAGAITALLFLPKSEHYDLMLLYMNYLLKKAGIKVMYLGTNISNENLEQVALEKQPRYIFTYNTPQHPFRPNGFQAVLDDLLPDTKLFISGTYRHDPDLQSTRIAYIHYRDIKGVFA